ncbi:MAG TPA: hypothetical protein VF755_26520 [Catenuloplanes sp.]
MAALLGVLSLILFSIGARTRLLHGTLAGDEPHYLVFNVAMEKYRSFDIAAVYRNRDYWSFYPGWIEPHLVSGPAGQLPLHSAGGPVLWHIPYLLWDHGGAMGFIAVVSALTVVNIYYLLRELGIVRTYAGIVTALFAVGTPLYIFSSMLFIEPIGALAVIYAVRVVCGRTIGGWRLVVAATGLGIIPWVQGRFALFTVTLGALLLWRVWRTAGRRSVVPYLQLVVPLVVFFGGLELYNLVTFGTLSPAPGNATKGDDILVVPVYKGLFYILLDRSYGLIANHPLFALVLPGVFLTMRRRLLPIHLVLGVTVLPYLLGTATYNQWWAGYAPAARFLVVLTPLLAFYVAAALQRLHHWTVTALAVALALFSGALSVAMTTIPPLRWNWPEWSQGQPMDVVGQYVGLPFVRFVPSAFLPDQVWTFAWWAIALSALTALLWWVGRSGPADRLPVPDLEGGARPPTGPGTPPTGPGTAAVVSGGPAPGSG